MTERLRRLLAEYGEGARILASRRFWADFRWYWLTPDGGLARALDDWAARLSLVTGKPHERRYPAGGPESWPWPSRQAGGKP